MEDASMIEAPEFKLAKVGVGRKRKRSRGAGLFGGGAGVGSAGADFGATSALGAGSTVGRAVFTLMTAGVLSAGAWQFGRVMANRSVMTKPAVRKLFVDKSPVMSADVSGVVKGDNSIPNSLGYVSVDGLTDEQRAKKAAAEAAARQSAQDAQSRTAAKAADSDVAADKTPSAQPAPAPGLGAELKKALSGGKFGGLTSGVGGGSALSGGAGLSGGIGRNFGAGELGGGMGDGQKGALSAFRTATRAGMSAVSHNAVAHSSAKGFARQQLMNTVVASHAASGTSKSESAAAGAAAPFENNAAQGTAIGGSGMGMGAGSKNTAPAPTNAGGPVNDKNPTCGTDSAPDANGACRSISTPTAQAAAPYQSLINMVLALLAIVGILSAICLLLKPTMLAHVAVLLGHIIGFLGVIIGVIGMTIAAMPGGDFMIGAIVTAVGGFIAFSAFTITPSTTGAVAQLAARELIATSLGMLAAASAKAGMLQ